MIYIIGPFPPPYGGISVHIQRMVGLIQKYSYEYLLLNESSNKEIPPHVNSLKFHGFFRRMHGIYKLIFTKYRLVHYHSPNVLGRVFISTLGRVFNKSVYIHVHGNSLETQLNRFFWRFLLKLLSVNVNYICDNENIYNLVLHKLNAKKIILANAFLPPLVDDSEFNALQPYKVTPGYVFIVGWIEEYDDRDLYGIGLALSALNSTPVSDRFNLLIKVNGVRSERVHANLLNYIEIKNLNKYVTILYEDMLEIWPLFVYSSLFIRPTYSDGSALSIDEALLFDVKVIASDCVPRQDGAILFKSGDALDLRDKILKYKDNSTINSRISSYKRNVNEFSCKLITEVYSQ